VYVYIHVNVIYAGNVLKVAKNRETDINDVNLWYEKCKCK